MAAHPTNQENRLAVINVVGLCGAHLRSGHMPRLVAFAARGGSASFKPTFPALTCSAQSTFLTGGGPGHHGIVGNGWYDRESAEVRFWKQPDMLVKGEKIWHKLRQSRPEATTAKTFWWYNMYSEVEYSMTPRPLYPADGRKIFDIHTEPPDWRFAVQREDALGPFPFRHFWGPAAGIESSAWIADAARWTEERESPTLQLVYLPHLDYPLQAHGPGWAGIPSELEKIDNVVGDLVDFFDSRGVQVVVLSEYGISAVHRDVALNRVLRREGWLRVKDELGLETLDAGASAAFAVADHQIAHVYVNRPAIREAVREVLASCEGVAAVLAPEELGWAPGTTAAARAGDWIAVADPGTWFSYYYWVDDARAPDFARTVDIHRKPGYDPAELFIDPQIRFSKLKIASFLLRKKLGLRGLLEVVPIDGRLVRGSHGLDSVPEEERPVYLGTNASRVSRDTDVCDALLEMMV